MNQYIEYITQDVTDVKTKTWLLPAIASHLFGYMEGKVSRREAMAAVTAWMKS